jgi:hypothetical protein
VHSVIVLLRELIVRAPNVNSNVHLCFHHFSVLNSEGLMNYPVYIYRVIHKSLRDFRPLRYSSRDGHVEGEHVNRGRDTASFCPTLQVLDSSCLLCLYWLLRSQVRKFRTNLSIIYRVIRRNL